MALPEEPVGPATPPRGVGQARLAALSDVAMAAGLGGDLQALADLVAERARDVAGGDGAVLRWFDPDAKAFRLVAAAGLNSAVPPGILAGDSTAIAEAFKDRQPVIDNHYLGSARATEWGRRQGIQAEVAVPLLVEGKPVGTLAVLSFASHTFTPRDGEFLALLAAMVAPAMERARLAREVERGELLLSGAFAASVVGMALAEPGGRLARVNPAFCRIAGYTEGELIGLDVRQLLSADDREEIAGSLTGIEESAASNLVSIDARIVRKDGHQLWCRMTSSSLRVDGGQPNILLHLIDITEERRAAGILKAEQARLSQIVEAQRDIAGSELDLEKLLGVLALRAVRLSGADAACVLLPQGDQMVVRGVAGASMIGPGLALPIDGSVAGAAFRSGRIHRVADAWTDPRAHHPTAKTMGVRAIVSTPIKSGEAVVGALQLMSGEPEGLDDLDLQTVEMIAGFAGAAFERASTTARLQASERRTRAVIESSPDPIVILDTASGAVVEFNPAAEAAFGRPREEAIGRPATELVPPRHVPALLRWLGGGAQAGSAEYAGRHFETTGLRSDGEEFPMEAAIADMREETRLAAAFIRDLSLLDKLRESRDRLAAVIAQAPVILIVCDRRGVLTLSDGQGLAAIGITDNIVGSDLHELLATQPDGLWHLEQALTGASYSGQIHLTSPQGAQGMRDIYLEGTYGPLRDSAGEFNGVSAILTNVTDRVRAESAQRESDAKSRLMAMMNHEVRTPLNSILGFAHLLKEPRIGELNDQQRRYVHNIEQAGNGLLDLINDSLDLARLKSVQPVVNFEQLRVSSLLERVADQVKPDATRRGIQTVVEFADGLAVRADERLLAQVLLNLLSNAIRHTPPGGSVTLSASGVPDGVAIEVRDTGRGIAKEDLERIFDEFYQAPNHASGGTGLGLTISRRLVQLMKGSIVADSQLNRGSVFAITLPSEPA